MTGSLASVHPELIPEWSEKNLPLTPDKVISLSSSIPIMAKLRLKHLKTVQPLKSISNLPAALTQQKKMKEMLSSVMKTASVRQRICRMVYIPFIRPPAGKVVSL